MMPASPFRRAVTVAALAAVAGLGIFAHTASAATARREPNGAIRFYDDNGGDRGYAWCLRRPGRNFGGWLDCSYYTLPMCRVAMVGPGGDCLPNPFASEVRLPPEPRRRR